MICHANECLGCIALVLPTQRVQLYTNTMPGTQTMVHNLAADTAAVTFTKHAVSEPLLLGDTVAACCDGSHTCCLV
jgi:hypothetical protein